MTGPRGRSAAQLLVRRLGPVVAVVLGVLIVDLATKAAVVSAVHDGQSVPVLALGGAVSMTVTRSPASPASTVLTVLVTVLAAIVVAGLARRDRRLRSPGWGIASGLVLGGALGDLSDRFSPAPEAAGRHVLDIMSVLGSPAFSVADVAIGLGAASMAVLALLAGTSGAIAADDAGDRPTGVDTDGEELDPDDEKVALLDRPKYPSLKWNPMPGTPRYLPEKEDASVRPAGQREPQDPDDLIDEDDRLPGRTRHPAAKWERD